MEQRVVQFQSPVENNPLNPLMELQQQQELCKALLQTPHYKKIGPEGIYAMVAKAKAMGVDPLRALNGGMYCVKGVIMLSASLMNELIRRHGHSVVKVSGDGDHCSLRGTRADNGDTCEVSFTVKEARHAGIANGGSWSKYPQDMCFNRALSRLARQLFPDAIQGCYIEGEIPKVEKEILSEGDLQKLEQALEEAPIYKQRLINRCKAKGIELQEIPSQTLPTIFQAIQKEIEEREKVEEKEIIDIEEKVCEEGDAPNVQEDANAKQDT